jgi:hypothetical protein
LPARGLVLIVLSGFPALAERQQLDDKDQLVDHAECCNPQKRWSRRADSNREPPDYK